MRRSTLVRLILVLAATAGLLVGMAPRLQAVTTNAMSCPSVSCLTQEGYDQCTGAGCGCDPRTDACVPKSTPTPSPTPACPPGCYPQSAYDACKACGGSCDARDRCIPPAPTATATATPVSW
jgi:hypothetical protein